jgi:tetratricopeptide (TPR) repeat protein
VAEETRKNRWFVYPVLITAAIALVGVSIWPILSSSFSVSSTAASSPSPIATQSPQARLEELQKQAEGYALVLQREPENQTALRGLLETRLALQDIKGAIEPLEKLTKLNPDDARMAVLLAQAKQQTGDLEAAAQVYRNVLQTKPGNLEALGGLTALLVDQRKPEVAISLLQNTLEEAPKTNQASPGSVDTTAVNVLLGKVFFNQKRYDDAIQTFDAAAQENPQNFQPVYYKAAVLKEQGKVEEAKPLFEKAVALAPAQFKDQIKREASAETAPKAEAKSPESAGSSQSDSQPDQEPAAQSGSSEPSSLRRPDRQ